MSDSTAASTAPANSSTQNSVPVTVTTMEDHSEKSKTEFSQMTDTGKVSYNYEWEAYKPSVPLLIPSEKSVALFTAKQGQIMFAQADALNIYLKNLHIAMDSGNEGNIAAAKEALVTGLQNHGLASSPDPKKPITEADQAREHSPDLNVIELHDFFNQGKTLFCKASYVKKCLEEAEKANRVFKLSDFLDPKELVKKLKETFANEWAHVKYSAKGEIKAEGQLKISSKMDDWIKKFNETCKNISSQGTYFFGDYEATAEFALMRYYAGASFSADFNPAEGKLNIKGSAEAKFDLAEAKADAKVFIPSKQGFHFKLTHKKDTNKDGPVFEKSPDTSLPVLQKIADLDRWLSNLTVNKWFDGTVEQQRKHIEDTYNEKISDMEKMEDLKVMFETGSAFIPPDMIKLIELLSRKIALYRWHYQSLIDKEEKAEIKKEKEKRLLPKKFICQMTGHTDTQGNSEYNLRLSEARVKGIYAFITKDVDYWEYLFSKQNAGDKSEDIFFNGDYVIKNIIKIIIPTIQKRHFELKPTAEQYDHNEYENRAILPAHFSKKYAYDLPFPGTGVKYYWEELEVPTNPSPRQNVAPIMTQQMGILIGWIQAQSGLKRTGRLDRATRKTMFLEYMKTAKHTLTNKDFMKKHILAKGEDKESLPETTEDEIAAVGNRAVKMNIFHSTKHVQTLDLGYYRLYIKGDCQGKVGANIAAAADIAIEIDKDKLAFRGVKREDTADKLNVSAVSSEDRKDLAAQDDGKWKLSNIFADGDPTATRVSTTTTGSQVNTNNTETRDGVKSVTETESIDKSEETNTQKVFRGADGDIVYSKERDIKHDISKKINHTKSGKAPIEGVEGNIDLRASVFAGANAGGGFVAEIQFKNPEKEINPSKESKDNEDNGFCTLAGYGACGKVSAGIGAEGEFNIGMDEDKNFVLVMKAGVTLGVGVTVGSTYIVNPENIMDFIGFIYTQLRDSDFDFIQFIGDKVMEYFNSLLAFFAGVYKTIEEIVIAIAEAAAKAAIKAAELAAKGIEVAAEFIDEAGEVINTAVGILYKEAQKFLAEKKSVTLANKIVENIRSPENNIIKLASPVARGQIIQRIIVGMEDRDWYDSISSKGIDEDYENAIFETLSWVQNQKDFTHTIISTCEEGRALNRENKLADPKVYKANQKRIFGEQFDVLYKQLKDRDDKEKLLVLKVSLPEINEHKSDQGGVRKNGIC